MVKDTIAVCIVRMDEDVQADSIKAITERAEAQGLKVEIFNSFVDLTSNDLHDKGEESVFDLLEYKHLCGIILFSEKIKSEALNDRIVKYAKNHNLPLVCIDRFVPEATVSITFDYAHAFEEIVEHLIDVHDCKSFYVMGGFKGNSFSEERINAARRVIERNGLELSEENIGYGDFWETPCRWEMEKFFKSGRPLPDAFIAANDEMAIIICDELQKRGIRIPEDVIVTGFDGIEREKYALPRLTTAETDIERSGFLAVDTIVSLNRESKDVRNHYVVPFHTRFSQSCGCEPILYNSASEKIKELLNNLMETQRFFSFMEKMVVGMTHRDNLIDMMGEINFFLYLMADYDDMYICLRDDVVEIDERVTNNLVYLDDTLKINDVKNASERKMVLLWEYHRGNEPIFPLTVFKMRDIVPDREKVAAKLHNMIFVPLHIQDKVYGYMMVGAEPHKRAYRSYELNFLASSLSQSLESVIQTIKIKRVNDKLQIANEQLAALYVTDPLTGINNRRGFYQKIDEKRRIKAYTNVMMVSIDLDGLKKINDKYGHIEGDRAIRAIAQIVFDMTNEDSVCARFGGDEFNYCLLMTNNDEKAIEDFKTRFQKKIDLYNQGNEEHLYDISASCGAEISVLENGTRFDELLISADNLMYVEKELHHKMLGI